MKKLSLLLFVIVSATSWPGNVQAQQLDTSWVRQYDRVAAFSHTHIAKLTGDKYLVQHGNGYYIINSQGDSLTTGSFNASHQVKKIASSDTVILMGSVSNNSPFVSRIDTACNIIWSTAVASAGFSEGVHAFLVDDGNIYAAGSYSSSNTFITKLDMTGSVIWTTVIPQTTFANLHTIIKLSDGNFLAAGNLDDYPLVVKFDNQGDTVWTYSEPIFISFYKAAAVEKDNQELILSMRNKILVLDPLGNRIDSLHSIHDYYDILKKNDTLYFIGEHKDAMFGGNSYPFVEVRNQQLDSLKHFIYENNVHSPVSNRFTCGVFTGNGGFIAAGSFRDQVDIPANTWNILCAKFNEQVITHVAGTQHSPAPLALYPNPAGAFLYIDATQPTSVRIVDMFGRPVPVTMRDNRTLDVQALSAGVYTLLILEQGEWRSGRFIK